MNIFFKSLFTLAFLLVLNIHVPLFGKYEQASQKEKIRLIKQNHTDYKPSKNENNNTFFEEWLWRKPGKKFLGLTWTNKVRRYSEKRKNDEIIAPSFPLSTREFCLKTKVLFGTALLGSFAGLGYYFEWYKK